MRARNGQPVLRIGLQLQVYIRGGHLRERRHAVVDVLADFAAAAGPDITHIQKHMANRLSRLPGEGAGTMLHAEVDAVDPETELYGPHVTDGHIPPRWQAAALLQPREAAPRDLSVVHLAMPATMAREDPDKLIARLTAWCRTLQPLHGTAGLAPIYEIGMHQHHPYETWPLLNRFAGLDYMNAFTLAARGTDAIQGVSWLTYLGTPLLEKLGGTGGLSDRLKRAQDSLAQRDGDLPTLYPYDGGIVVRAGMWPQLGDRGQGGAPRSYMIVAAALRNLLFTDYQNKPTQLIRVPRPLDAYTETLRWVTRFDPAS